MIDEEYKWKELDESGKGPQDVKPLLDSLFLFAIRLLQGYAPDIAEIKRVWLSKSRLWNQMLPEHAYTYLLKECGRLCSDDQLTEPSKSEPVQIKMGGDVN